MNGLAGFALSHESLMEQASRARRAGGSHD